MEKVDFEKSICKHYGVRYFYYNEIVVKLSIIFKNLIHRFAVELLQSELCDKLISEINFIYNPLGPSSIKWRNIEKSVVLYHCFVLFIEYLKKIFIEFLSKLFAPFTLSYNPREKDRPAQRQKPKPWTK